MNILENLITDRKTLIIMTIAYAIVVIIVLVLIWMPKSVNEMATYTPYDAGAQQSKMAEYYFNLLLDIRMYGLNEYFESVVASDYLKYTNTSIETMKARLNNVYVPYTVENAQVVSVGDTNIYSANIASGIGVLKVNFIETSPYDFKITYDSFYKYSSEMYYGVTEKVNIDIVATYQDMQYIMYEAEVINNNEESAVFDLTLVSNAYLKLSDGSTVYLSNSRTNEAVGEVKSGDSFKFNLRFDVPVSRQEDIQELVIDNVKIAGKTRSISIEM